MGARILGIGSAVPPQVVTNKDFEARIDTTDEWIVTRTGIRERRYAPEGTQLSDLAAEAGKRAMAAAGTVPEEIDALILATATPETIYPSTACWAQPKLGLRQIPSFDISAGCSGFLFGYIVADGLVRAGVGKRILLIGADMLSRAVNFEDRSTCVLFGDGSGAAVIGPADRDSEGLVASTWGADGSLGHLLCQPAGGTRLQASHETVDQKLHSVQMAGNEIFKYAVRAMQQSTIEVMEKAGVTADDIALFVPHQANTRIITATAERAGFPMDKVYLTIQRYGNTSAASIPTALADAEAEGRIQKGDLVLTAAFGAGLTWAAALFRW